MLSDAAAESAMFSTKPALGATAVLAPLMLVGMSLRAVVVTILRHAWHRRTRWKSKDPLARFASIVANEKVACLDDARRLSDSVCFWEQGLQAMGAGAAGGATAKRPLHLAIFPGSFNPPSHVHVEMARRVCNLPGVDGIWLDMAVHHNHKAYVSTVEADRMRMAELAVAHLPGVGVTRLQASMGDKGFGTEYFDMLRELLGSESGPRITWVMGSDVLMGMRWWSSKAKVLLRRCDQIVVFCRREASEEALAALEDILGEPRAVVEASGLALTILGFEGRGFEEVSSSMIRRYLVSLLNFMPLEVLRYIVNHQHLIDFYKSLYSETDIQSSIKDTHTVLSRVHSRPDLRGHASS
jgi:nicotinic acid mononucleotide adenylyltransferase